MIDRLEGVQAPFAKHIVVFCTAAARRIVNVNCSLIEKCTGIIDIADQTGRRRPYQGDHTRSVGRRHRGTRQRAITTSRHTAAHVHARCGEIGLGTAKIRRPAARKRSDGVADVKRPRSIAIDIIARASRGAAKGSRVSRRKGRKDARSHPRVHNVLIKSASTAATPRVIHHVGPQIGPRVVSIEVGGSD